MHYLHRTLILAFFILFFQKKFVVQACICRLLHIFLSYSYAQYLSLKNVPFFYSRQLQLKWVLAYYCNHLPKHVSLSIPWQWNDWKIIQMKIENSVWNFEIYLTAMWFISLHLTCAPPPPTTTLPASALDVLTSESVNAADAVCQDAHRAPGDDWSAWHDQEGAVWVQCLALRLHHNHSDSAYRITRQDSFDNRMGLVEQSDGHMECRVFACDIDICVYTYIIYFCTYMF